jgi:hypothetical protein
MISACYIWNDNCKEIIVIVKNYFYVLTSSVRNYKKLDHLSYRYSNLVLDKCLEDNGAYYCYLFISFINSKNKLEIYNYKLPYGTINYSLLQSKEIDLINSSGQISLINCEYINCHKEKNGNGNDFILVCFYENDNSEIGAISLNLDTLDLEKEVKLKKNSGAKIIKSVLFGYNEKVFVCYINNNDNVACIIFDVFQNTFLNEFKYIEKMTQSQMYFNIDYFSEPNQYILSTYSSETEFEFIIFGENMNILDDSSINKIAISPCNDESSLLSITIYYYSNYKIAKKCGNEDFSTDAVSEVSSSKSFSLEQIFITDNLIELPHSTIINNKYLTDTISSSNNLIGYLTDRISSTTISEKISSTNIIKTSIPSEQKTSIGSISSSSISFGDNSNNLKSIDIIQPSSIKSDKIISDIKSSSILSDEKFSFFNDENI